MRSLGGFRGRTVEFWGSVVEHRPSALSNHVSRFLSLRFLVLFVVQGGDLEVQVVRRVIVQFQGYLFAHDLSELEPTNHVRPTPKA